MITCAIRVVAELESLDGARLSNRNRTRRGIPMVRFIGSVTPLRRLHDVINRDLVCTANAAQH